MIRESQSAVVVRNDLWRGHVETEPYEAGWAHEAVIFVTALKDAEGAAGTAHVEISPDGMRWAREGSSFALPVAKDAVAFARVAHFGNWLRLSVDMPAGSALTALVTIHAKA
jgi:hypothetical protein